MRLSILHAAIMIAAGTTPAHVFANQQSGNEQQDATPKIQTTGELDGITVEGVRNTNTIDIDLSQTELQQSNSIFELFKNESSIDLGGGGASNAKRIYVRGVESSTLNITLDGATQGKNIFQHRGNELGINPDILKVVNVSTAPNASKAASLGGSIEMTTKDAQDFLISGKTSGSIIRTGYNTNTDSHVGSLTAYSVFNNNYGIVASASGVNNENYEDGDNTEYSGTAYRDRNFLLKFNADDINNHSLGLSLNHNSNSGDMQWGRAGSDQSPNVDPSLLEKIDSTTTTYTLVHNYKTGDLINLETDLNFSNILIDRVDEDLQYDNEKIGFKIQNHFYLDTDSTKNKLSLGLQVNKEETEGEFFCSPRDSGVDCLIATYAPVSTSNRALFVQGITTINPLDIRYGLRFDDYAFETGLGDVSESTLSPIFGLDYRLSESSYLYANYGKSSRMSGTVPFTWMTNIAAGSTYSSELESEKSTRFEIGYNFKTNELFTDNDIASIEVNIFRTSLSDMIISKDVNCDEITGICGSGEGGRTLQDIYNSSQEFNSNGVEIKTNYYVNKYFASLSLSHINTDTENDDSGLIAEVNEQLAIRRIGGYDSRKFVFNTGFEIIDGLTLDYTLTAVAGIDNSQLVRGGYTIHNISAEQKLSDDSPWTFYATVNNLTDKYYANHSTIERQGEFRRDIGRDVRLSVKYEL